MKYKAKIQKAKIQAWDAIDQAADQEAAMMSRRMTSVGQSRRTVRDRDLLVPGSVRVFGASGAGEGRKSLGQILQGCR